MSQLTDQPLFDQALRHHQAGRLAEAEDFYRQVLASNPDHAGAMHYLGVIAHQAGRNDIAVELIRHAIVLRPDYAEAHNNLGIVLKEIGQLDAAITVCRRAIALKSDYADAYNTLGSALKGKGQFVEAIAAHRHAVALKPGMAEGYNNLGLALADRGDLDEAMAAYRQAIALKPGYVEPHGNLGNALRDKGQLEKAIVAYRKAIELNPSLPQTHYNLANALRDQGQLDEAIAAYRRAITLQPNFPEALGNLGNTLKDAGQLDAAIASFCQAVTLNPNDPDAHNNLGSILKESGRLDEALTSYRQAIALRRDFAEAHSSLVLTLHYHPGFDAQAIAAEYRRWNAQQAEPLRRFHHSHSNTRDPARPLRVGYVSPDFRDHVVGRNLLPLFRRHDRGQFQVTCYSSVSSPDATTAEFQQYAAGWRDIARLSDEQAARQIREDQIDILVDLSLHTAQNRLLVFARKPAPVQATFAGYPGSTGLSTIDYRLSDPYLDPVGRDESVYSEKTIRLPDTFWCYDPLDGRDIPVNSLPALEKGFVTFGCLNNFCKVTDVALDAWGQVLRQVSHSRLLLLSPAGGHRQRVLDRLGREGIEPERIEFISRQSRQEYLKSYHRIDVGLDSFPYNGHTTSLDSFWMGVPVVTRMGRTAVSRAGWSQLSNLGLSELAGETPEQFVRIAVELAGDLPRLRELRSTLRQRMEASPLMDGPRFARNMEAAYRRMWRTWCEAIDAK